MSLLLLLPPGGARGGSVARRRLLGRAASLAWAASRNVHVHVQRVPLFYASDERARGDGNGSTTTTNKTLDDVRVTLSEFPAFDFQAAQPCTRDDLLTVHARDYVDRVLLAAAPRPGTLQQPALDQPPKAEQQQQQQQQQQLVQTAAGEVTLSMLAVGAALQALDAIKNGNHMIAGTLTGGYHHVACRSGGQLQPSSGTSGGQAARHGVFNDLAIAAVAAIQRYNVQRVLICDLDAQRGDGTAAIFQNDPRVVTFSMHAQSERLSVPSTPPSSSLTGHGDYDVDFKANTPDAAYLDLLRSFLDKLIDTTLPQLIIYQAGVSHLSQSQFQLTRKGLQARNMLVYQAALKRQVPVLITCGESNDGPITEPRVQSLVTEAHCDVYRGAFQSIITHNHRQFFF